VGRTHSSTVLLCGWGVQPATSILPGTPFSRMNSRYPLPSPGCKAAEVLCRACVVTTAQCLTLRTIRHCVQEATLGGSRFWHLLQLSRPCCRCLHMYTCPASSPHSHPLPCASAAPVAEKRCCMVHEHSARRQSWLMGLVPCGNTRHTTPMCALDTQNPMQMCALSPPPSLSRADSGGRPRWQPLLGCCAG
jgi:hypothetical protein